MEGKLNQINLKVSYIQCFVCKQEEAAEKTKWKEEDILKLGWKVTFDYFTLP